MFVNIDFNSEKSRNYQVFINELRELKFDTKVAIITNKTVEKLHIDYVLSIINADFVCVISVDDGEEYKNIQTIEYILDECFKNRLDRKSILIALGGGVVGDMTGFVASIFERGIKFIQIPTTLLSQVDASVGGKTGVNSKYGKNLIGSFWQPERVYCETKFLETLPKREFYAGVSEIIKMAVTFDEEFFIWLEEHDLRKSENLQIAIQKSLQIKAKVVSKDEREEGVRAGLNYGHTFAHVIENETQYMRYLHGEAVSIGIVMANRLSCALDLMSENEAKRVKNLLVKYNLPIAYDMSNPEEFYEHFFLDKKSHHGKITFVLAKKIGSFELCDDLPKNLLLRVLGG